MSLRSYLATSFSKHVADNFARRAYHTAEGDHPAVMYTVLVSVPAPSQSFAAPHYIGFAIDLNRIDQREKIQIDSNWKFNCLVQNRLTPTAGKMLQSGACM